PALITSLMFLAACVALVLNLLEVVAWVTPFAEGWRGVWRERLRGALAVVLPASAILVMVVAFTTGTLALGSPIYDKIDELVEEELGGVPEAAHEAFPASVVRSSRQSVAVVVVSLVVTVSALLLGLMPVVGGMVGRVSA